MILYIFLVEAKRSGQEYENKKSIKLNELLRCVQSVLKDELLE